MDETTVERLAYEIVRQAVVDYVDALRYLAKHDEPAPNTRARGGYDVALNHKNECEWFFRHRIDYYVDMDGEQIMEILQNKATDKKFKTGKTLAWEAMEGDKRKR